MGYQGRVFKITFEDSPGLEVVAKSLSLGKILDLAEASAAMSAGVATPEQVKDVVATFVGRVRSWTLADEDDEPLPVTMDALMEWDGAEAIRLAVTWMERAAQIAVPLASGSGAAKPSRSLEDSIPMGSPGSASEGPPGPPAGM